MAWAPPRDECRCEGLRVLGNIIEQWASLYQRQGDVFDDLRVRRACGDGYGGCEQEPPRRPHPRHRAGSVAWIAVSAASSASSFSMSSSRRRRSASSDWAMSIRNMGNGPRRMAPPRPVSGAGEGVSWDGVERSDMVGCGKERAGGLWPQYVGGGEQIEVLVNGGALTS